ncbi:hypothetical protein MN202_05980 [Rheinheimera muenzenbergensis]|uniref:DUF3325 domain-containing protein n=1 Tax=Rheinheimera muenzenbergensis TaxID=1193628 RepID=A0ABU8C4E3_9GAMM
MNLLLTLSLLTLAVALCYFSNKHQRIFSKAISKQWRILSVVLLATAAVLAVQQLSWSATVFFLVLFLMLSCILLPLLTLLKKEKIHHDRPT